jgi:predicted transposase YbfD/YdcC
MGLSLTSGIASHDTFQRVFQLISPKELKKSFLSWVKCVSKKTKGEIISIDGKTVCGSQDAKTKAIHMVSAWANANQLVLGQVKTEEKSNEITAIPTLLEMLELKDCIVTIDAMGCQKNIVEQVIEKQADYVLALKENQPTLLKEVILSFDEKPCHDFYQTLAYGHGRIEERKCSIIKDLNFILDKTSWKDLRAIVRIDSKRTLKKTGEIQEEKRYYISSITDAEQISRAIRCHWGIENKVHWCLDMVFGEDSNSKRKGFSAQNFSLINKIALNLIRKHKENDTEEFRKRASLKSRRKMAFYDEELLLGLLNVM